MKKLSLLLVLPIFLTGCFNQQGAGSVSEEPVDDVFDIEVELPEMTEDDFKDTLDAYSELFEEPEGVMSVSGSCNSIAAHSVCVDYMGSYWKNEEFKKLNCSGPDTVYSENSCPYSEIGGCQNGEGTMVETIIWMYQHGGDPITDEVLPHAIGACNAVYGSQWVLPEF